MDNEIEEKILSFTLENSKNRLDHVLYGIDNFNDELVKIIQMKLEEIKKILRSKGGVILNSPNMIIPLNDLQEKISKHRVEFLAINNATNYEIADYCAKMIKNQEILSEIKENNSSKFE